MLNRSAAAAAILFLSTAAIAAGQEADGSPVQGIPSGFLPGISTATLLAEQDSNGSSGTAGMWIGIGGLVIAAITLVVSHSFSRRTLIHQAHESEIQHIDEQLNGFYGPFRQLLGTSKLLHEILQSRQADPKNFRTLTALLHDVQLKPNDQTLIREIIAVTQQLDKLIVDKCGLIDAGLQPWLWQASTHFRLLKLAQEKALFGEAEQFEQYVYPRKLNDAIDKEIDRLTKRREELKQKVLTDDFAVGKAY